METSTFDLLVWTWMVLALVLLPVQLKITAPYGRHAKRNWGFMMDNRTGWVIMELVSPLVFAYLFLSGVFSKGVNYLFFIIWMLHYANRSILFPLRTKTSGKKIPVLIVGSAIFFNLVNAGINGYHFGHVESYTTDLFRSVRFWSGVFLFSAGAVINLSSDERLLSLRKGMEKGYKIPHGGLFRWISCPNHFGEMLEWFGFAIMAWSLPALSFAVWTAANLVPRALSHHRWYLENFADYPQDRKAVLPYLL